jgi:hypothetical protein
MAETAMKPTALVAKLCTYFALPGSALYITKLLWQLQWPKNFV